MKDFNEPFIPPEELSLKETAFKESSSGAEISIWTGIIIPVPIALPDTVHGTFNLHSTLSSTDSGTLSFDFNFFILSCF